jgi:hypothetical protein
VSFYKYLGVFFTPKLAWYKTQETLSLQGIKASACIFNYQRQFGHIDPIDMFKIFDSMVKPILCYASEIWGYNYVDKIESLQLKFCKQYCNLSQNTASYFALGECGRLPLCTIYMTNCIKYWLKLTRMGDHRYPKHCYLMLKRLHESGRKTWAGSIKDLLFKFGFGYVWVSHDVGDDVNFINIFKQRLTDCYSQN